MTSPTAVPGLPFDLTPSTDTWEVDPQAGTVTVVAEPHSDIFVDPGSGSGPSDDAHLNAESLLNAATLLGVPPEGDFRFSARVTVGFASTFDAGVLLLWFDEKHWAKLCFEFSPAGEAMIVSVVNRVVADDANAFVVDGRSAWLRMSRIGGAYAFHASLDGSSWRMIRFFALDGTGPASVGFEAQSPTGEGCRVAFDDVRFDRERVADLRDGS